MPRGKPINLTGQRFDKLLVVEKLRPTASGSLWLCRCDCGGITEKLTTQLRRAVRTGCKACEHASRSFPRSHGATVGGKPKLYMVWKGMLSRCRDAGNTSWNYYGRRGISVCDAWRDYPTFEAWAIGAGYKPGLSIDRIDSEGDYVPDNCEWVTRSENSRRAASHRHARGAEGV